METKTKQTQGAPEGEGAQRLERIPLHLVRRSPYQVRREEVPGPEMLASVAVHGLINPVTVRPLPDGAFELIAGHRRFAAFREVRPEEPIPAIVLAADDMTAEDLLVAENFFRRDLTLMEEAMSVAQLRAHGRTVEQVAAVVHKSERWVYRRMAIGGVAEHWREFFHAWDASYDEVKQIARLPLGVQRDAWTAFIERLADDCDFKAPAGDADGAKYRADFIGDLESRAGDKAQLLDLLGKYLPGGDPEEPERIVRDWFTAERGLAAIMGAKRLLDPKTCPFDCARECKGCTKRSDVQADLFADDDGARAIPRCHDGGCWRAKAAAAAAKKTTSGTDGNKEVPALAPPSASSSDALPESGKKEGLASLPERDADSLAGPASLGAGQPAPVRASSSSPAPEPETSPAGESRVGSGDGGNDRGPARAEVSSKKTQIPAGLLDLVARLAALYTLLRFRHGDSQRSIMFDALELQAGTVWALGMFEAGGLLDRVEAVAPHLVAGNREMREFNKLFDSLKLDLGLFAKWRP